MKRRMMLVSVALVFGVATRVRAEGFGDVGWASAGDPANGGESATFESNASVDALGGDNDADPLALDLPQSPVMASAAGASGADNEGVYAVPEPPTKANGVNLGGVSLDLSIAYFNHNVYRGVDHSIGNAKSNSTIDFLVKSSSLNLDIDTKLSFDLGKFPHPFVGLHSVVYDADPLSRFQEIRPFIGAEWTIKPFTLEGGNTTYIYPDRENLNTAEVYGKVTFDDSVLLHMDKPFLSPYFYGAYDYDKNNGWYLETGVTHDFTFEDLGLTFTLQADAAYIIGLQEQFVFINELHDTGFQHFDVGLKANYSLNRLFHVSYRFGEFDLLGFLFSTGKLDSDLTANNVIWGGAGIGFKY